jgi:hypothetical protein
MDRYQKGKIYKIVCDTTDKCYIGSTCENTLARRLTKHLVNYKRWNEGKDESYMSSYQILENDDYDIILLENYPCNSKDELHTRERYWIENTNCVNKVVPIKTDEEKLKNRRLYLENNKEHFKGTNKEYYENNKVVIKEKAKVYVKENKDKIKKNKKEYCEKNKELFTEKGKQYREEHKEEIVEYKRAYYNKPENKLHKLEQDRLYRLKHSDVLKAKANEKCICACGGRYTKHNISKHIKSVRHIEYTKEIEIKE